MNQPYDATISPDCDTLNACERLIERYAPGLMRAGGGALPQEVIREQAQRQRSNISPEILARVLELGRTGKYSATEIARMVNSTQSAVAKTLYRAGISVKDGRGGNRRTVAL